MKISPILFCIFVAIGSVTFNQAIGLENKQQLPIEISSSYFKHNGKKNQTLYEGEVKLKQGNMELNADAIEIKSTAEGSIISIEARGNLAHFEHSFTEPNKPPILGQAQHIYYDKTNNILILKGNAEMAQGSKIQMESDFIEYLADVEEVRAKGQSSAGHSQGRVNIIIPPAGD